ncbi:hypothetical protein Tco_1023897 [Tanacetum coccineum]
MNVYHVGFGMFQPVPQEEDEREPRFIQAPDPDFMPELVYLEYFPLEDEHVLLAEEQPLPPVDSPTAESLGYVTESDPEEDPLSSAALDVLTAQPACPPSLVLCLSVLEESLSSVLNVYGYSQARVVSDDPGCGSRVHTRGCYLSLLHLETSLGHLVLCLNEGTLKLELCLAPPHHPKPSLGASSLSIISKSTRCESYARRAIQSHPHHWHPLVKRTGLAEVPSILIPYNISKLPVILLSIFRADKPNLYPDLWICLAIETLPNLIFGYWDRQRKLFEGGAQTRELSSLW